VDGQGGGSDISEADISNAINKHATMATKNTSGHIYNFDDKYFTNNNTYGFSLNFNGLIDNKTIKLNNDNKLYCTSNTDDEHIKQLIINELSGVTAGMEVGTIFAYASSEPPEGALALNRSNY
jgi:hypothetical protein